jgi:NAD(P)-dependent dehydrogenase (short-subunit alcohol dehydrogenase family)
MVAAAGFKVALTACNTDKLSGLVFEIKRSAFVCNASEPGEVLRMFSKVADCMERLDVVMFNDSARVRGPIAELDHRHF